MNQENPWAGQGPVLLDIGGGVGAVVVTMPAVLDGIEVEARPPDHQTRHRHDGHEHDGHGHDGHGHDGHGAHQHGAHEHSTPRAEHWPHVAVVARPAGDRVVHSLVFPELATGTYALCLRQSADTALTVDVQDGEVTFATWPDPAPGEPDAGAGQAGLSQQAARVGTSV